MCFPLATGFPLHKFPGDNSYWVTSEYDALGRITAQNRPTENGQPITTRYAYNGLTTTVTDPNGH
jgi:streptogramin lyase